MHGWVAVVAGVAAWTTATAVSAALPPARFHEAVLLEAAAVPRVHGAPAEQLALVSCRPVCAAIPWQLDERDPNGDLVLDRGEPTTPDDSPGVVDGNDLLLFMASDVGDRVNAKALPRAVQSATEIEVSDPRSADRGWVYLLRYANAAPRSAARYVRYDAATDRLYGAAVVLGYERGTPRWLSLAGDDNAANLLDRMNVRAGVSFLWGLITVRRTEDDVLTLPVAWHEGAIRIVRRQPFWIRLTWRWRTPIFGAETVFYRDFAEMPVTFHLNFTPRLLFGEVAVRVSLAFRDLRGWEVETPRGPPFLRVDGHMTSDKRALAHETGDWFALHGPTVTLVQLLTLSPSLSSVRPRLSYQEDRAAAGALPDIGYQLTEWDQVASGDHWFAANAYAMPREQRASELVDALRQPLGTRTREVAP